MRCLLAVALLSFAAAVPSLGQEVEPASAPAVSPGAGEPAPPAAEEKSAEAVVPARPATSEPRLSLFAWVAYGYRSDVWDDSADLGIGGGASVRLGPSRSRFRGVGAIVFSIPDKPAPYDAGSSLLPYYSGYILYEDSAGRLQKAKGLTYTYEHYNRVRGTLHGVCILNRDARVRVHVGAGAALTRSFVRGRLRVIRPDGSVHYESFSGESHVAADFLLGIEIGRRRLKPLLQWGQQKHEANLRAGVRF